MRDETPDPDQNAAAVLRYHTVSSHRLDAYAPGPDRVDWDTQPDPTRGFIGAAKVRLPLGADRLATTFGQMREGTLDPAPLSADSIAVLLELAFGLSAWKALGPNAWPLRVAPSSGNLHPVEPYVLAGGIAGLDDGLYHYTCMDHALERRARAQVSAGLWIGFASIQWREAWKYGVRAFRYCQLDTGHALAALRFAAAALGWQARVVPGVNATELAALLGTDRTEEFVGVEAEDPDVLVEISTTGGANRPQMRRAEWFGRPSRCDLGTPKSWPGLAQVTTATGEPDPVEPVRLPTPPPCTTPSPRAADVILNRRSARRFTSKRAVNAETLHAILEATRPQAAAPFDLFPHPPAADLILWVHHVEGVVPGLYAYPRASSAAALREALDPRFAWEPVPDLPIYRLRNGKARREIRELACHQGIAAEGAMSIAILSPMARLVGADPWRYRELHWEAGAIGQALYLAAEAEGIGASGVGCFFDPESHRVLGVSSDARQVLYLFALGHAVPDPQLLDGAAYPGRRRDEIPTLWPKPDMPEGVASQSRHTQD